MAGGLVDGFEKMIIGLEFQIEKGKVDQASIAQIIAMYTMAADHYDHIEPKQAEIYR